VNGADEAMPTTTPKPINGREQLSESNDTALEAAETSQAIEQVHSLQYN